MPTFASDVKPASTGLRLGNENQKWDAYVDNIFVDTILSNTANAADDGSIRLSSADFIAWRNTANTGNVKLSKTIAASSTTPADTLVWDGPGISADLISPNLNPASTGEIRFAINDTIKYRNDANSADITVLSKNSNDTVNIGGSAGVVMSTTQVNGDLTVTGTVNAANVQRLDGVVNAAMFGGIDMAAKINAAIASLAGPGRVIVPTGTYAVATQIRKPKGIDLDLQGSTLNFAASALPCIVCGDTSGATTQFGGIRNGIISGAGAASNPVGIWLGGDSGGTNAPTNYVYFLESFVDLTVQSFAAGYKVGYKAYQISWFDGIIQQCTWGIQNANQYYSENLNLHGTQIINNTGNGIVVDSGSDFHLYGCSLDYNQGGAIYLTSGGISMHGGNCEQLSGLILNSAASSNGLLAAFYNTRFALTDAAAITDPSFILMAGTNSNLIATGVHLAHLHTVTEFVNWTALGTANSATIDFHDDQGAGIVATNATPNIQSLHVSSPLNVGFPGRTAFQVAGVDLTGQTAAVTTTTIYTPVASGLLKVVAYLKITTAGTSPVIGPVTIAYTDATDSVAQSIVMALTKQDGTVGTSNNGNTTTSLLTGMIVINAKVNVAVTYAIALTGTVGAGVYEAHLRLESM